MDIFFNGQPVPQHPRSPPPPVRECGQYGEPDRRNQLVGLNVRGAPNTGPYGDDQTGEMYPVTAPGVFIGTTRKAPCRSRTRRSRFPANSYICTGPESGTVGPQLSQHLHLVARATVGNFQVPPGLTPGSYNLYIDESNTTPSAW